MLLENALQLSKSDDFTTSQCT